MARAERIAKAAVGAAMEFYRRRPWKRVPSDAPFLVRIPTDPEPLAGAITGQDRSDYGLLLLRGEGAFQRLSRMILEDLPPESSLGNADVYCLSFEPLGSFPEAAREPLRAAGFSTRREDAAPLFMRLSPGRQARPPRRGELEVFAWCLQAVLAADSQGELPLRALDAKRRRVVELTASGRLSAPDVGAQVVPWPGGPEPGASAGLLALDGALAGLPQGSRCWLATLVGLPARIRGEERSVRAFIVADRSSEEILAAEIVLGLDLEPAARKLEELLRKGGRPAAVATDCEELHEALAPALTSLGIRAQKEALPPFVGEFAQGLRSGAVAEEQDPRSMPQTLEEYKELDRAVCAQLIEAAAGGSGPKPRALARYFGSEQVAEQVLEELAEFLPLPAFAEWFAADYRSARGSKSWIEKRLRRRLPPAEREILEARRDAELSIWRVDACQPGVLLEVEDILSGERRTVHDRALADSGLEGWFLPLRLIRVGEWTFPVLAGPALDALQLDRAMGVLDRLGADLSPGGLRRRPEFVGRLWKAILDFQRHPPRLSNTDGEAFELQRATFEVTDARALQAALSRATDVDFDRAEGRGAWIRPNRGEAGPEGGTVLAHLELIGEELLVEVNSRERLERARAWLERLPGLRFKSVATVEMDEVALDDLLPGRPEGSIDPELLAEMRRMHLEVCRRWLDESVPSLEGLTPRQAVLVPRLRPKVAALVRSMPPMGTPAGPLPAPRSELLRELGLER